MNKTCTLCKKSKPLQSGFYYKKRENRYSSNCKECQHKFTKTHYEKNKQHYLDKAKNRRLTVVKENIDKAKNYLINHPCVDCNEKDINVLDFDHIKGRKHKEVSVMIRSGYNWKTIKSEIDKCEIRCANCHRRRTRKITNTGYTSVV